MKIVKRKSHKLTVCLLVLFTLALHTYVGPSVAFALSYEEETILGQKFLTNIRKYFDFVDDEFANAYIKELGQYLIRPLETKHFPFRFYIIKDNEPNAFAGPGGHIFIFAGLVELMDEIDELAAVISHEVAHISARHLSHRIEQNKKINLATMAGVLAAILIGGEASGAIMTGSLAAGIQAQLSYSRNDERQADQLGFKYTQEAGFDPSGMITTLKKMEKNRWLGSERIPTYLQTHPGGPERMSNIEVMMTAYSPEDQSKEVVKFRRLFPFLKTILRAKSAEPHEAERLFSRELEKDPNSALAHFGLGIVYQEMAEYAKAIDHYRRALEGQPESAPIMRHLGETYQLKGQNAEAITVLQKVLNKDAQNKSALFLLAMSYQNLEEYPKAIQLYERLRAMEPVNDRVFYNLGVSYGRLEKIALAHYNFGLYFKRLGKAEKAKFHFQKAIKVASDDPALRNQISKSMKGLAPN